MKQTWVPTQKPTPKEPVVDEEGYQMVGKGAKFVVKEKMQEVKKSVEITNSFITLGEVSGDKEELEVSDPIIKADTVGEGEPLVVNG